MYTMWIVSYTCIQYHICIIELLDYRVVIYDLMQICVH